jgi:photosystem II stability/assembly factor-like uncharacterized protein
MILRSDDAGESWHIIFTDVNLMAIHFVDRMTGWAVGAGQIVVTHDGGDSWTSQALNVPDPGPGLLQHVFFVDDLRGVAVGAETGHPGDLNGAPLILTTSDGGQHWARATLSSNDQTSRLHSVCLTPAGTGVAVGFGVSRSLVLVTNSTGTTWTDVTGRVQPPAARGTACAGNTEFWIVDGPPTIVHSRDNGSTWSDQTQNIQGPQAILNSVAFADALTGWTAGGSLGNGNLPVILHTTDGGARWIEQTLPSTLSGTLLAIDFPTSSEGVVVGVDEHDVANQRAVVLTTHTGGLEWIQASVPPQVTSIMDVSAVP